jgi:hypothetical protein
VAGEQLAFGPATVTLFGVIVPVFPALAGMLSVYLARLIAPKDKRQLTGKQAYALLGLLMLVELALIVQYELSTPKATLSGMLIGWMGLLVPETGASVFWSWFKDQLRGWLSVAPPAPPASKSHLPPEERLRIAQKIFAGVYPTETVPDDLEEIIDRLKQL